MPVLSGKRSVIPVYDCIVIYSNNLVDLLRIVSGDMISLISDIVNVPLIIFGGDFNSPHLYSSKDNPSKEECLMF